MGLFFVPLGFKWAVRWLSSAQTLFVRLLSHDDTRSYTHTGNRADAC